MIIGIALFLLLIAVGTRLLFPPYAKLSKELPEGNFTACELFHEFAGDPTKAYIRLSEKVIILEGEVSVTSNGQLVIKEDMCLVRCKLRRTIYDRHPRLQVGNRVTLKGVCQGMNMAEVLVTHCIVINRLEY